MQETKIISKAELRRQMKQETARYDIAELQSLSAAICSRLHDDVSLREADIVMAFWPMASEPDIRPLIRMLHAEGKTVMLPRVTGATTMEFCLYDGDDSMMAVPPYGIMEPTGSAVPVEAIDEGRAVMLVPGVAFDSNGFRLGHGCGYYDRYLARLHVPTIAVCFPFQLVGYVPTGGYDVPVNRLTP